MMNELETMDIVSPTWVTNANIQQEAGNKE